MPANWQLPAHLIHLRLCSGMAPFPRCGFPRSSSLGWSPFSGLPRTAECGEQLGLCINIVSITHPTLVVISHHLPSVYLLSSSLICLQIAAKMPPYRLACPFSRGGHTTAHQCQDGVLRMTRMRKHLREFHGCNCPDPYACTRSQHIPQDLINRLIVISLEQESSPTDRWARMYKAAFPTHRIVPGPCVPRFSKILSIAEHPGPEFKKTMVDRLARAERLSVKRANKKLQRFLNRLPLFYDVLSWPEAWNLEQSSVSDESGDEVDEPSTTQPVGVAEPLAYEEPDLSVQQDDGVADEKPDTQAEQETLPSAPSSS